MYNWYLQYVYIKLNVYLYGSNEQKECSQTDEDDIKG